MAEPPTPQQLAQIRDRNHRLSAVPFDTHDGDAAHGAGCIPCELVRTVGDVQQLLAALDAQCQQEVEGGGR